MKSIKSKVLAGIAGLALLAGIYRSQTQPDFLDECNVVTIRAHSKIASIDEKTIYIDFDNDGNLDQYVTVESNSTKSTVTANYVRGFSLPHSDIHFNEFGMAMTKMKDNDGVTNDIMLPGYQNPFGPGQKIDIQTWKQYQAQYHDLMYGAGPRD